MNHKNVINILGVVIVILMGTTAYFATINNASHPTASTTEVDFIKVYSDEKNGFKIQYPSIFTLVGNPTLDSGHVVAGYESCNTNDKLCPQSDTNRSVSIDVSDNLSDYETIDEYYQSIEKDSFVKNIQIIKNIEQRNEDGTIREGTDAVRYEFYEIPKQQAGGYTYVMIKNGKIFNLTILSPLSYDGLLDRMMQTFTWTK